MGNCLKPVDPLAAQIPRDTGIDASVVRASGVPVVFIIGAPGSGKRTHSTILAEKYGFLNMICADILRDEVSTRSERGVLLARIMSAGRLVPADVLIELIKTKMLTQLGNTNGFFITGFPRDIDQGKLFDKQVKPPDLVIYLHVKLTSVLLDRVLAQQVTTTSQHQSVDVIQSRLAEYKQKSKPILRYYKRRMVTIDSEKDVPIVYDDICKAMDNLLKKLPGWQARSRIDKE